MGIPENIKGLRRMFKLTQDRLGDIAGVTGKAVWTWENGTAVPRMTQFQRMADYFGLPKSVLIDDGGIDRLDPVTRKLDPKTEFKTYIPREDRASYAADPKAPLYGRIAAGTPIEKLQVDDELWIPPNVKREHPRAFFLEVKGESMNRVLPNGTFALVDPDAQYVSGDVLAVNVNGNDATIKRVYSGIESVTLAPESYDSRFEEERFTDPEIITPIGRVVWGMPPYGKRL